MDKHDNFNFNVSPFQSPGLVGPVQGPVGAFGQRHRLAQSIMLSLPSKPGSTPILTFPRGSLVSSGTRAGPDSAPAQLALWT